MQTEENMPKEHISVGKTLAVSLVAVLLILLGLFLILMGLFNLSGSTMFSGFIMVIFGLIAGGVNKLMFRKKTTQLSIDVKEAVRNRIGNVCPNCGARNAEGARFCNNCGYKIK